MNHRGKSTLIFALISGIIVGTLLNGAITNIYNRFLNDKIKSKAKSQKEIQVDSTNNIDNCKISDISSDNRSIPSGSVQSDQSDQLVQLDRLVQPVQSNVNLKQEQENTDSIDHQLSPNHKTIEDTTSVITQMSHNNESHYFNSIHDETKAKSTKKEKLKIREIDKSPLELRKRFDKKGFVFISHNLATINTELNEFIELMRKLDLQILNGCKEPNTCNCNFRHRRCRLFMIRKYSDSPELQFFAPSCAGVVNISPSNTDIQNGTPLHEFVQLFQNVFSDRIMDLISYINFIVDPERQASYVVDVTLIADPYNQPTQSKNDKDDGKIVVDTTLTRGNRCSLKWHQDRFIEARTNKTHPYDYVAMFLLNLFNVTPHRLMIGKTKDDIDVSNMTVDEIQQHVVSLTDVLVDSENNSDIGYVIDQGQGYMHKHSDFDYLNDDAKRNVITIRLKYLN